MGNNVDAFVNLYDPDGFGDPTTTTPSDPPAGDYRAQVTAPGRFLHSHTPDLDSGTAEARQGAIQQLFYDINFLHDWYYDAGFDDNTDAELGNTLRTAGEPPAAGGMQPAAGATSWPPGRSLVHTAKSGEGQRVEHRREHHARASEMARTRTSDARPRRGAPR